MKRNKRAEGIQRSIDILTQQDSSTLVGGLLGHYCEYLMVMGCMPITREKIEDEVAMISLETLSE